MIETPVTREPSKKLETLEVLRAFAALSVVAFHASQQPYFRGYADSLHPLLAFGKYGVQVFFVLSGFIILFIHGKDLGRPEKTSNYFYRRWLRIWPLYAALTLIQVAGKPFIPGREGDSFNQMMTSLFFLDLEEAPIITVGWTLVHEAFFYLTFGVLIVLGCRFAGRFTIGFLVCLVAFHFDSSQANALVEFIFSHSKWYFLAGVATACFMPTAVTGLSENAKKIGIALFSTIGILGIIGILQPEFGRVGPSVLFLALAIGLTLLVLVKLDLRHRFQLPRFLVYLGAASYSIYLLHSTVLDFGIIIVGKLKPDLIANSLGIVMAFLALISVVCGVICHQFFEKPLIKWVRSLWTKESY
jgi:peptidoglycan/LPS O-acetylase OafA/YrhL